MKLIVEAKLDVTGEGLFDAYGHEIKDILFHEGKKYEFKAKGLRVCGIDELGLPHIFKGLNDPYLLSDFQIIEQIQDDEKVIPRGMCVVNFVRMDESKLFAWTQWDFLNEKFGHIYNHDMKYVLDGTEFSYSDFKVGEVWTIIVKKSEFDKCLQGMTYL